MSKKRKKTMPKKGKSPPRKAAPKKTPPNKTTRKREADPKMIVRNNSNSKAMTTSKPKAKPRTKPKSKEPAEEERKPILERVGDMGGSHVAATGVVFNALGVLSVGKGWTGPKTTAGIMLGTGTVVTGSGWYWDMEHIMAAGIGATAAGAFSMANVLAVEAYEAMEKRAEEKHKKKEAEEEAENKKKQLADARALLESEDKKHRNSRRIKVVKRDEDDSSRQAAA